MLEQIGELAIKNISKLLKDCVDFCLHSNDGKSFEEKILIWEEQSNKIYTSYFSLKYLSKDDSTKQKLSKLIGVATINTFAGIFFIDFIEFKLQIERNENEGKLRSLKFDKFELFLNQIEKIVNRLDLLIDLNLNPEISTEVWTLHNEIPKTIELIESKLKEINSKKEYFISCNQKSAQAFNLGFYILNSQSLWHIPPNTVFKTIDDFKDGYFPNFQPLNFDCYRISKVLFDLALKFDSQNTAAAIFKVLAEIEECNRSHEECNSSVIKLESIVSSNPLNGLANIELAYAYSCIMDYEKSKLYIDKALMLSPESAYIKYKAYKIYFNTDDFRMTETDKKLLLLNEALKLDPYNPQFYYDRASFNTTYDKNISQRVIDIDKAIDTLCHISNKEYFWSRRDVYHEYFLKYPWEHSIISEMKNKLKEDEKMLEIISGRENRFKKEIAVVDERLENTSIPNYKLEKFKELKYNSKDNKVVVLDEFEQQAKAYTINKILFLDFCSFYDDAFKNKTSEIFRFPSSITKGKYCISENILVLSGLSFSEIFPIEVKKSKIKFLSIDQFKMAVNAVKIEIVFNKKTNKLCVLADETDFYKCQQSIDITKSMAFALPEYIELEDGTRRLGTIDDACLVSITLK
jgi:tetratricopeptide (TPR) repeat protein